MTPEEIGLVTASVERCQPLVDVAHDFYRRLFEAHPELRSLFPADIALQEKKFAESIATIVEAIPDFDAFADRSAALGRLHALHRIGAQEYAAVGPCLLGAIAAADPAWDDATADAWGTAYDLIAESMLANSRRPRP